MDSTLAEGGDRGPGQMAARGGAADHKLGIAVGLHRDDRDAGLGARLLRPGGQHVGRPAGRSAAAPRSPGPDRWSRRAPRTGFIRRKSPAALATGRRRAHRSRSPRRRCSMLAPAVMLDSDQHEHGDLMHASAGAWRRVGRAWPWPASAGAWRPGRPSLPGDVGADRRLESPFRLSPLGRGIGRGEASPSRDAARRLFGEVVRCPWPGSPSWALRRVASPLGVIADGRRPGRWLRGQSVRLAGGVSSGAAPELPSGPSRCRRRRAQLGYAPPVSPAPLPRVDTTQLGRTAERPASMPVDNLRAPAPPDRPFLSY
jgi:hypothetical protein